MSSYTLTSAIRSLSESFRNAVRGIWHVLKTQRNARIHLFVALLVVAAGLWLRVSAWEWATLSLAIGLVVTMEMLNTAVEEIADASVPDYHPLIGTAKDVASGAVLVSAVTAVLVGIFIFIPRLLPLLHP